VVGIVCSRLTERFHRPAILLQRNGGLCSGSGRSVEGVNLHGALHACREHLMTFGGHDMAAGLKLSEPSLPRFTEALIETVNGSLAPADLSPRLRIDCEATLGELSPRAAEQLEQLAPFGPGNPRVSLLLGAGEEPLVVDGRPKPLGSTGKHFAMFVRQGGRVMRLVAWRKATWLDDIPPGARIEAVVTPKLNVFNGRASVEPELLDLRVLGA
jgi:single-stranded-DNA-specific exonuclease